MKSKPSSPREHYQHEKARRASADKPDSELLADAKREYLAMLEAAAAKGKGGRPKKNKKKPAAADDLEADAAEPADQDPESTDE